MANLIATHARIVIRDSKLDRP
ncbi:hypothetical protein OG226_26570 [Streptomyces sp. NBC_01261]